MLEAKFTVAYRRGFELQFNSDANREYSDDPGRVCCVLGPSGCGKTTVMRSLAGLLRPNSGYIRFDGVTWFDAQTRFCLAPQDRRIGFLQQSSPVFPHLSCLENIELAALPLERAERRKSVEDVIERFDLRDLLFHRPDELSGGQRQRLALAQSLVRKPRLLLLDEPLQSLDVATQRSMRQLLREYFARIDAQIIIVTHEIRDALALANSVIVMEGGRILQQGPIAQVFARPCSQTVAEFLGIENICKGIVVRVDDDLATIQIGNSQIACAAADLKKDDSVWVFFHGTDVILTNADPFSTSARNRLFGRVMSVDPYDEFMRVRLDCGFELQAIVTRQSANELRLAVGETIAAIIKASVIHATKRV